MKRTICVLLAALLLPLAGCGGPGTEPEAQTTASGPSEQPETGSFVINPLTDCDSRFLGNSHRHCVVDAGDVFYWFGQNDAYIRYANKTGGDWGVLCGKPECLHDEGNACVMRKSCSGYIGLARPALFLAESRLYYIDDWTAPRDSGWQMYSMAPDGSDHRKEAVLSKIIDGDGKDLSPQRFSYHRGRLYAFALRNTVVGDVPDMRFALVRYAEDYESVEILFEQTGDFSNGWISFFGDYCYIFCTTALQTETGTEVSGTRVLRLNTGSNRLEELYCGEDVSYISTAWVTEEGVLYTPGKYNENVGRRCVLRLVDGQWEEALAFDDGSGTAYDVLAVSDHIAVARNYEPFNRNGMDPDIDLWVKSFDGDTLYKGKLPMAWMEELDRGFTFERIDMVCGDASELLCIFQVNWRNASRSDERTASVFVRYEITDDGLAETILCISSEQVIDDPWRD